LGQNDLVAEVREGKGKGVARKLRAAGRIPAVLYGRGKESRSLTLDPHALERLLRASDAGMNTLIDLRVAGPEAKGQVVLVKELQRDPVRGVPLHADLYQVDLETSIDVSVPIHLVGQPRGVELHDGILDHSLRELEIACLPRAIPESFEVDVSELEIGDTLHVRDLALPEGVELRSDADLSVASVVAARVVEEETPVEGEVEGVAPAEGAEGEQPSAEQAKEDKSGGSE
jgi:large subunit ribosomal protein L25